MRTRNTARFRQRGDREHPFKYSQQQAGLPPPDTLQPRVRVTPEHLYRHHPAPVSTMGLSPAEHLWEEGEKGMDEADEVPG